MNCKFGLSLDLIKFSGYLIFMGKDIHLVSVIIRDLGYWQEIYSQNSVKFGAILDHICNFTDF